MADTKISALTEATSAASTDLIAVVDVDDTTMASSGTTKRITKANLTSDLASSSHTHTLSDVTDSGTAAAKDVPSSGDASSTEVVLGDDSRLTDARTPSSHTHTLSEVTDSGTAAAKDVPSSGDASSTQVVMGDDSRLTEVTLAGTPDYITISGQEITRNQIDLTADVTGSLPDGNIASAATWNALTTNATHTGEVTGSGALTVADDVIDEANLKIDNAPTDDYVLTAKSSAAGGLTWASAGSGSGDMTGIDITAGDGLDISQSNTTSGDYTATISADLKANGGIVVESTELAVDLGASSITGTLADGDIASASTWNAKQDALTHGIADTNTVKIDSADVEDDEFARFTANGLEGRSASEVLSDIGASASGHTHTLGTDTSGNYVATITGGTGISSTGATTGETVDHTLSLDLGGLTDDTGNGDTSGWSAGDFIAMVEGGGDEKKIKPPAEIGIAVSDESTAIELGDDKATIMIPRGMTLTEIKMNLTTASSSGVVTTDIRYHASDPTSASSILYTTFSISASAYSANTVQFSGASPPDASYEMAEDSFIVIDIDAAGTGAKGLKVWLLGYWT